MVNRPRATPERQMPVHVEAAYKDCSGQHNFSEETAVGGDELRPACICGYFPNLG
jgi:hypothetical protein